MVIDIIYNQGDLDKLVEKLQGSKRRKRIFDTINRWLEMAMIKEA